MKTKEIDFLIVGSGIGGMTASLIAKDLGMELLIIEKGNYYGGSSALSGGAFWIPNNRILIEEGIIDEPENIVEYLRHVTNNEVPVKKLESYIEEGPKAIDYLLDSCEAMEFQYCRGYSDYHPHLPHANPEGHSVEPLAFDLKKLKDHDKLLPSDIDIPMGMWLTGKEFHDLNLATRTINGFLTGAKAVSRAVFNIFQGRKMGALGQSLIGRFRYAMQEKNIPISLNTPFVDLILEGGKVVGAIIMENGEETKVLTRKGVLLASGGFEHNKNLRKKYLPPITEEDYSAGHKNNTGDAVSIFEKYNLADEFMDEAWWMPSVMLPNGKPFTLVSERAIPRSIIVDKTGNRFTKESSPYVNFVHDQIDANNKYIWQIVDKKALNRYMYAGKAPMLPIPKEWFTTGMVFKAESIEKLAKMINIPADNFVQTVKKWNSMVDEGVDHDFGRGENAYDRYYGDPTLDNPGMDYINKGPYYAFKVVIGDLGTKGGIKTNEYSQAIKKDGTPLEGLYATGNASGSVMGRDYAGAGATIGPSLVFAYIAAKHANDQAL